MNSTLHKKMKFSIKDFFSKCDPFFFSDFVTFTEEILNGKLHFLCIVITFTKIFILIYVCPSYLQVYYKIEDFPEVRLEPNRTSTMKLKPTNYFRNNLHRRYSTGF